MRKVMSEELRKNAKIVFAEMRGAEVRKAIAESLLDIAMAIEEDEIPVKKLMERCYLKGVFIGAVITQVLLVIIRIFIRVGGTA